MNKPIAIIQTGKPVDTALKKYGHFNQWFIKAMRIDESFTETYAVYEDLSFPDINNISGLIISGSPSMVTEKNHWSEKTIEYLTQFLDSTIPVLGVCYGHQLLAKLLGGTVDWNPLGRQMGQVSVDFNDEINNDRLFQPLLSQKQPLPFIATHQQAVTELPDEVTILGTTVLDKHHCFRYKKHMWGLQFHPEFNAAIIKDYISTRSSDLIKEGFDPKKMINEIGEIDHGSTIMQSFKNLCLNP